MTEDVKSRVDATGVTWESQKSLVVKLIHLIEELTYMLNA